MKTQIVVEIQNDGAILIQTRGYQGEACLEESQFLKDLLGEEIHRQLTPAYYHKGRKILKKHLPLCG